ncbi:MULTISPECIES: DUF2187 family protein [Virgibacillus]|uniref:DUF2187 domain-containing protein n=2 Tax=Virgibacillus TaxID=84406 RepID=A0A024Q877_9BACI|nr:MULTISPECIES: DUF2187 family protein [Virgibacillus]EQB37727.1 hypothetical protein M948_03990 [Virgibacillus sp. CM-4]MYL40463.1 DUF2187 domain-containing protein [Virgibacillus massiliensis]GGJ58801.1 hypothetical protein GCM10007111_20990 [Virgibacillus kapii]CDQ38748.1 hypothetical protein BN990_01021 [Virgibacillus massiliensis]
MFKADTKKANPGDIIEFEKENYILQGQVLPSNCKRSIIVDISSSNNLRKISHGFSNTVVAHENYRIIQKVKK